jgi:hypothetical protein
VFSQSVRNPDIMPQGLDVLNLPSYKEISKTKKRAESPPRYKQLYGTLPDLTIT